MRRIRAKTVRNYKGNVRAYTIGDLIGKYLNYIVIENTFKIKTFEYLFKRMVPKV